MTTVVKMTTVVSLSGMFHQEDAIDLAQIQNGALRCLPAGQTPVLEMLK